MRRLKAPQKDTKTTQPLSEFIIKFLSLDITVVRKSGQKYHFGKLGFNLKFFDCHKNTKNVFQMSLTFVSKKFCILKHDVYQFCHRILQLKTGSFFLQRFSATFSEFQHIKTSL